MAADHAPPPVVDPAALARAEAALATLSANYLSWADADVVRLTAALHQAQTDPAGPAAHLAVLFRIAHDMKGQAATFGYPLVTTIAGQMCHLIGAAEIPTPRDMSRVAAHVAALVRVVASRLEGDGGAEGQSLLRELDA